jgi:hypothetical protein
MSEDEDFSEYLEHAFQRNFVQGQYNNTVRDLYKILQGAFRLGADALLLTPTHLTLARGGAPIRQMDLTPYEQADPEWERVWVSFCKGMQVILNHDERARQHVRLAEETPGSVAYTIVRDA